ncbi:hypothetical protein AVEN_136170-1 [Araneus ventricosus]|uniref:Uncharacterized protein n=1 Tax=Araneus ventricosus TaxID=182803 RepID=A0A4Y2IHR2_ARAVE|nr:hypothetical protein AVEN_136170-1 [Araneus ventricosus]
MPFLAHARCHPWSPSSRALSPTPISSPGIHPKPERNVDRRACVASVRCLQRSLGSARATITIRCRRNRIPRRECNSDKKKWNLSSSLEEFSKSSGLVGSSLPSYNIWRNLSIKGESVVPSVLRIALCLCSRRRGYRKG